MQERSEEALMNQTRPRRQFLRDGLCVAAGLAAGTSLPAFLRQNLLLPAYGDEKKSSGDFEKRLKDLGIELPPPAKPVAVYVPAVITGNLLFTSGHIPFGADGKPLPGRIGQDLTVEQGAEIARSVGLSILTTVRQTLGSLDRVVRLVKATGMVNCTADINQQPKVVNGFSELMVQVFGEDAGKAARSAVGMISLPGSVPVEIEAIFEIRN
jgi:enamine deaminase RidA (YjgF/YER057c/UK114 family)